MNYYLIEKGEETMSSKGAIGVFDSGLGGLTVAKEIMKLLPRESIVYFGDTGRVPYGTRSCETIRRYALEDERFLLSKNVKIIVAACGTVSSVAADTGESLPVPFVEVVTHSCYAAARATKNGKIGVLATSATVQSGAHREKLLSIMPDAKIIEQSGTLLVPLVEEGWTSPDDAVVTGTLERYLAPMKEAGVDTVILGCTHFPILSDAIKRVLGEGVTLINMGVAAAERVRELLVESDSQNDSVMPPVHRFFVSDKPQSFSRTARTLLGEAIDETQVEQVNIKEL